jgi:hypothetical protein
MKKIMVSELTHYTLKTEAVKRKMSLPNCVSMMAGFFMAKQIRRVKPTNKLPRPSEMRGIFKN